ncbi:MAG TPA: hypothetical protein VIQ48_05660 [Rhodanobacter sp.]|jgi:hypothetical protein
MRIAIIGKSFRVFSHVVLLAMAAAIVYAAYITFIYWSYIAV